MTVDFYVTENEQGIAKLSKFNLNLLNWFAKSF